MQTICAPQKEVVGFVFFCFRDQILFYVSSAASMVSSERSQNLQQHIYGLNSYKKCVVHTCNISSVFCSQCLVSGFVSVLVNPLQIQIYIFYTSLKRSDSRYRCDLEKKIKVYSILSRQRYCYCLDCLFMCEQFDMYFQSIARKLVTQVIYSLHSQKFLSAYHKKICVAVKWLMLFLVRNFLFIILNQNMFVFPHSFRNTVIC